MEQALDYKRSAENWIWMDLGESGGAFRALGDGAGGGEGRVEGDGGGYGGGGETGDGGDGGSVSVRLGAAATANCVPRRCHPPAHKEKKHGFLVCGFR